jgi:monoterpene epsilon-lactone hydrolase
MADQSEIDVVRSLLSAKPRPVGWKERRQRIEEVGSVWPVADDIELEGAHLDGFGAEWSIAPGSDASRVLMFFHGGGYCSGSVLSHRRLVTEAGRAAGIRTLAVGYRLAPENPFPAAYEDAMTHKAMRPRISRSVAIVRAAGSRWRSSPGCAMPAKRCPLAPG